MNQTEVEYVPMPALTDPTRPLGTIKSVLRQRLRAEYPWKNLKDIKGNDLSDRGLASRLRPCGSRTVRVDGKPMRGIASQILLTLGVGTCRPRRMYVTSVTSVTALILKEKCYGYNRCN
jgi:hypothetical protein